MSNLPDVAGSLFTTTYRNVRLAGKAPPTTDLKGTGSVSFGPRCGLCSPKGLHARRSVPEGPRGATCGMGHLFTYGMGPRMLRSASTPPCCHQPGLARTSSCK